MPDLPGTTNTYLTPTQLTWYFDERDVRTLVRDDNTMEPLADLDMNEKAFEIVMAATGEVEAAMLKGLRYTAEDIALLMFPADGSRYAAAAYIRRIVAGLAMGATRDRRLYEDPQTLRSIEWAEGELERIKQGDVTLPLPGAMAASVARNQYRAIEDFYRDNHVTQQPRLWGTLTNRQRNPWRVP